MPDNQRLLELALKGLEAERLKIAQEIKDLTSQIGRQGPVTARADKAPRDGAARATAAGKARTAIEPPRKGRLTAAGRKKTF